MTSSSHLDSIIAILVVSFLLLFSGMTKAQASDFVLNVYVDNVTPAHQELIDEVRQGLEATGWNSTVRVIAAGESVQTSSDGKSIVNLVLGSNIKDYVNLDFRNPTLFALISDIRFFHLIRRNDAVAEGVRAGTTSLLAINQSLRRQLLLLQNLSMEIETVGVIVDQNDDEIFQKYLFTDCCSNLVPIYVDEKGRYRESVLQKVDAIIQYSVDLDLSVAKRLIYHSYQLKKPLIGYSRSYANAGALGAVFLDWDHYAREIVLKLTARKGRLVGNTVYYTKEYQVSVNRSVAKSLRLPVGSEERILAAMKAGQAEAHVRGYTNTKVLVR